MIPNTTTGTETGNFGSDTQNVNNARLLGRVANKGAEGLAITPDGRTLVVALQSALIQDGGTGPNGAFTRIVAIDIPSGNVKAQYAYPLFATKPGKYTTISEILAINNHQFLVDERDGKGFEGGGSASYKMLNLVDLQALGVADVSNNPSFLASFVLDDDLQSHVYDNPNKVFVFAFEQADLDSLGTANTAQGQGWKYVAQPLVSEQVPDDFPPELFPSFLFGLPSFHSHDGY